MREVHLFLPALTKAYLRYYIKCPVSPYWRPKDSERYPPEVFLKREYASNGNTSFVAGKWESPSHVPVPSIGVEKKYTLGKLEVILFSSVRQVERKKVYLSKKKRLVNRP